MIHLTCSSILYNIKLISYTIICIYPWYLYISCWVDSLLFRSQNRWSVSFFWNPPTRLGESASGPAVGPSWSGGSGGCLGEEPWSDRCASCISISNAERIHSNSRITSEPWGRNWMVGYEVRWIEVKLVSCSEFRAEPNFGLLKDLEQPDLIGER